MAAKHTIIFNPFAQSEKAGVLWYDLYKVARKSKIKLTKGPGNATKKAAKAARNGSQVIVAAGGDGTINEVLNGIVGTEAVLGIMPIGSVNVLARELKIPLGIQEAWNVIETGEARALDLIKIEYRLERESKTRYFIQLAGIGLDAHIVKQVTRNDKKKWGPLSYVLKSFRSIGETLPGFTIKIDGKEAFESSFALIGNGSFYGGSIPVFHKASMTDGLLDICSFQTTGWLDLIYYLQAVLRGVHSTTSGIIYQQGKTIEITSNDPVPIEGDGEFIGYLPAKVTVVPSGLKIMVPRSENGSSFGSDR